MTRADDLALIERVEAWLRDKPELRDSNLRRLCALARLGLDAQPREPTEEMLTAACHGHIPDVQKCHNGHDMKARRERTRQRKREHTNDLFAMRDERKGE